MGLFDKKYCDICGEKISFLGNRKLEDGNMCSTCAKKISPLLTDRRGTTIAEMKEHFTYRDANKTKVAAFRVSEVYGDTKKIYLDRAMEAFIVSYSSEGGWEKENPDVIPLSEVTSVIPDIKEHRKEIYTKDKDGKQVSYNPPRYEFEYNFFIAIHLSSRWFSEIELKLNTFDVRGLGTMDYHKYEVMSHDIQNALTSAVSSMVAASAETANEIPLDANGNVDVEAVKKKYENIDIKAEMEKGRQQILDLMQSTGNPVEGKYYCTNCNKPIESKFCPDCGSAGEKAIRIVCSACGTEIDPSGVLPKFCSACGNKLSAKDLKLAFEQN